MNEILKDVERRMIGAVEAYQTELAKLRTGRASLALIDGITVDYYGSQTPLWASPLTTTARLCGSTSQL